MHSNEIDKNEYIDFVNKFKLCKFTFQKENI